MKVLRHGIAAVTLAVVLSAAEPPKLPQADRIVVEKAAHTLTLMHEGKVLKSYKVALGSNPVGPKMRERDGRTPEGQYRISGKNDHSQFHLSLRVSYPNDADRERAKKMRVNPGGDIFIHGLPSQWAWLGAAHRTKDWTLGCIAVTNAEIEEIYARVPVGTPIEIRP